MLCYVAFLRGINVGGHRVASAELRARFEDMGLQDAVTFRASGNVIFSAEGDRRPDELAAVVEAGLAQSLGYEVPAFLRTATEVLAIASHDPFDAEVVEASDGKLQVALLSTKPTAKAREQVLALANDEDRLTIRERELYWLPSGGMMESALDLNAIGALLGPATMRTKGTVNQIAAKYLAD